MTSLAIDMKRQKDLLIYLKGKQEWSVKVFRNEKRLKIDIAEMNPDLKLDMEAQTDNSKGKNYMLAKRLTQDLELAVKDYSQHELTTLINDLGQISEEWCQNETFSVPEKKDEDMVVNFAFLVSLNDTEKLRSKVDEFNDRQPRGSFYALYTGPWLPYNFIRALGADTYA